MYLISFVAVTSATAVSAMLGAVYVAARRAELQFYQNSGAGVLRIALPLMLVAAGSLGLFFAWGVATVVAVLVALLTLPRLFSGFRFSPAIDRGIVRNMGKFSALNYLASIIESVPNTVLPLIVLALLGSETTAYFRISWTVANVVFLAIPISISTAMFAEGSNSPQETNKIARRAILFTVLVMIPAILVFMVLGDKILLIFGKNYSEEGTQLLRILAVSGIPISFIQTYLVTRMIRLKMKEVIVIDLIAALLVIVSSYVMVRYFGMIGFGLAWTLSYFAVAAGIGVILLAKRTAAT